MAPERSRDVLQQTVAIWLALMAFAFPISLGASSFLFFTFLGFYLLAGRWTWARWPPAWGNVEKSFLIFWSISLTSAFFGVSFAHSQIRLSKDLYVVLIPLLTGLLAQEPEQRVRLLRWLVWGGVVTAICGILQAAIGIDKSYYTGWDLVNIPQWLSKIPTPKLDVISLWDGRATGFRSHPLTFAETLLFPLAYVLSQLSQTSWRPKVSWFVVFGILVLGLLVSQSRGPWLAFGGMVLMLAVFEPRKQVWWRLAPLVVVPAILLVATPQLRQRVQSIASTKHLSNSERLIMWQTGLRIWKEQPLLGVGPGNVVNVSEKYQAPEHFKAFGAWGHLHNIYVNILVERGLLGFAAFMLFLGVIAFGLWKTYRTAVIPDPAQRTIVLTGLLAGVGWMLSGLTEAVHKTADVMLLYFVLGIAFAVRKAYCRT